MQTYFECSGFHSSTCCKKWFDCAECHKEASDHPLGKMTEMVFACKKCKKVFRKDIIDYEEQDEFCPHCDNKYVLDELQQAGYSQKPAPVIASQPPAPTPAQIVDKRTKTPTPPTAIPSSAYNNQLTDASYKMGGNSSPPMSHDIPMAITSQGLILVNHGSIVA